MSRTKYFRGATLIRDKIASLGYFPYPRQLTCDKRRGILGKKPLTTPSTVHLIICFSPDSQQTQALCGSITTFISVSTVLYVDILAR